MFSLTRRGLRVTAEQGELLKTYAALYGRAQWVFLQDAGSCFAEENYAILPAAVRLGRPRVPCPPGPSVKEKSLRSASRGPSSLIRLRSGIRSAEKLFREPEKRSLHRTDGRAQANTWFSSASASPTASK
ncbi:hypothetical protein MPNT_80011 [Candidatus Methylacidithermus pantelleriae]|uniref:Uncharacterized protein n=1 Tax=Candidatus Methylacidithermus pantelleriae TaxID=2744239 RepID=A0A8J2FTV3_9BACT|nr:hypothetical protein MPNT_80011 [Candidatus Methylacidithermus pantelleriae]